MRLYSSNLSSEQRIYFKSIIIVYLFLCIWYIFDVFMYLIYYIVFYFYIIWEEISF